MTGSEETYEEVRDLIYHMVHLFRRRHGGDWDELVAEANFIYAKAYRGFDPDNGCPFTDYLCVSIYRGLLRCKQKEMKEKQLVPISLDMRTDTSDNAKLVDILPDLTPDISAIIRQIEELPDDASIVIDLIISSPKEFLSVLLDSGPMYNVKCWRGILRRYLRKMGWTNRRVSESFDDIGNALTIE